jgi:hypothetical protein
MNASYDFPLISKSPYRGLMLLLVNIFIVGGIGLFWIAFTDPHSVIFDKLMVTMTGLSCGFTFSNAFIRSAPILIDEKGLHRIIFGKVCYRLEWSQIKRISVRKIPDYSRLNSTINVYLLDTNTSTNFHIPNTGNAPFIFNDKRTHLAEFLDALNTRCIQQYHVPVIDCRESPPVTVSRL